jgi:hypothetical protein
MKLDLNSIVSTLKQIFALVAVAGGTILVLKILGVQIPVSGTLMDWAAVTIGTSLASK